MANLEFTWNLFHSHRVIYRFIITFSFFNMAIVMSHILVSPFDLVADAVNLVLWCSHSTYLNFFMVLSNFQNCQTCVNRTLFPINQGGRFLYLIWHFPQISRNKLLLSFKCHCQFFSIREGKCKSVFRNLSNNYYGTFCEIVNCI